MENMKTLEDLKTWEAKGIVGGLVMDLDIDVYHHPECPGYSKTSLDKIEDSPASLVSYRKRMHEPRDWGQLGNAAHVAILQPKLFEEKYVKLGEGLNFAMKEGKSAKIEAEEQGKIILRHEPYLDVLGMRDAVEKHPYAKRFLLDGEAIVEGSAFWVDPDSKVLCKTRPDRFRLDGVVAELKTTENAKKFAFQRSIVDYRYAVQAAFQMDGMRIGADYTAGYFCIIAIEKEAPYHINVFPIQPQAIEWGRRQYKRNLQQIVSCEIEGNWPARSKHYPSEMIPLDLPNYVYEQENK